MPRYEFHCPACEVRYDEWLPLAQAHLAAPCPLCKGPGRRHYGTVGIIRGGRRPEGVATTTPAARHGLNCLCCRPRPAALYGGGR